MEQLVDACLVASSRAHRWSPLNTLEPDEKRQWIQVGFREIIRLMLEGESPSEGRVYFPRVSESEGSFLFGAMGVLDSCECVLLPDEAILPMLWDDYRGDPELLLQLTLELRRGQNLMT
ncbi:MAG: hypothetical protein K6F70_05355, partial [Eggerthellaceae bacterium]|nr:hypothetical protein [Eggerthellaceae bacterium]